VNYLLDTNVISEWVKPKPRASVIEWLHEADDDRLFLSVVSIADIRRGIELLPSSRRKSQLITWLDIELTVRFEGRIIDITRDIADNWGVCMGKSRKAGRALEPMDAFFAATAVSRQLVLVTRNTLDFEHLDIGLYNPWND
jgi:predicted nucleic acid-binding protein